MNNEQLRKKSIISMIWRFAERAGAQGIAFVVSIILANLLEPGDNGVVALLMIFITIFQVFVDSGLANALIQKKDADSTDYSSVFFFNMGMCLVIYGIIYCAAPCIAAFYENDSLTNMMRVLGLTIIISSVRNVQQAYVTRNFLFKKFFFSTLFGTIFSAFVGIPMAYFGYGPWALVAQNLVNNLVGTFVLCITVRWHPTCTFSFRRLKGLLHFGWKLLAASLIDTLYSNIRSLIIGKIYTTEDLAFYNKGKQFPNLLVTNINTSIDSALFPAMVYAQDNTIQLKSMTRRSMRISSYVMWPLMIGLAVCADSLVKLLLTEKWLPCVPYIWAFCITFAFYPIHTANLNAIKALGRSDLFLKLDIAKKIVGIISVLVTIPFGPLAMAIGMAITAPISSFINALPNKKLLNYSYFEQLLDTVPSFLLSVIMGIAAYSVGWLNLNCALTLCLQIIVGIVVYVTISYFTKNECFRYLLRIILKIKNDR